MTWFGDHGWLAWVGIALALGAIELASVDFVFLMLAGGALAVRSPRPSGVPVEAQVLVSLAVAALALLVVGPSSSGSSPSRTPRASAPRPRSAARRWSCPP